MPSLKAIIQRLALLSSDVLALLFSLIFAELILCSMRGTPPTVEFQRLGVAKLVGLLVIVVFWYQEQYVKRRPIWEELNLLYKSIFIFALLHLGVSFLISHNVIKWLNILFWAILLLLLPSLRYITKMILIACGVWQRDVYIIGTGHNAQTAYTLLKNDLLLGYNVVGFVSNDKDSCNGYINVNNSRIAIVGLEQLLQQPLPENFTEIIFAVDEQELLQYATYINLLQSRYTFVSIIPDIAGFPLYGVELNHFFGNEYLFLRLSNNLSRRFNRLIKRIMDVCLSLIAIILLSPLFAIIIFIIKYSTKEKVFFQHKRIGFAGKNFYCLKFQTMYPNAGIILRELLASDENARNEWERDFKLKDDPRVTKIGKFLRKTSLDELPQLFNVLKGDMSLVGPRPIVEQEISRYGDSFYYYKLVHPGVTGIWQISGRNDIDYSSRVKLDVWYVKNWSIWYDLVIMFKTILVVMKKQGAY